MPGGRSGLREVLAELAEEGGGAAELAHRLGLDLPGALAAHPQLLADLAEGPLADIESRAGTGIAAAESVPAAIAAAMLEPVFEEAVFAAVNAGGAADTIGALTGALAGVANGASGIPQDLIDGLEGRIYVSLAAPWFHKAARQRAGQLIDLKPRHGPRPDLPPRR